jgi:hypothetical protein
MTRTPQHRDRRASHFWLLAACLLLACRRDKARGLNGDEEVVARVNGSVISRYDVEAQGKQSLGKFSVGSIERVAYPKLVEATIQRKAIALAAERDLEPLARLELDKQVGAYRDELLVRHYLATHSPPRPVTREMAFDYYQRFPQRFGARKDKSFELVGTTRSLAGTERTRLLSELEHAADEGDWKAWAERLETTGQPVTYSRVTEDDRLLNPKLRELLLSLKDNHPSPAVFVQGRTYVARTAAETERPPRPFEEVRPEIERLLGPSQVSDAVTRVAPDVLKNTHVELVNVPPAPEPHPLLKKGAKP